MVKDMGICLLTFNLGGGFMNAMKTILACLCIALVFTGSFLGIIILDDIGKRHLVMKVQLEKMMETQELSLELCDEAYDKATEVLEVGKIFVNYGIMALTGFCLFGILVILFSDKMVKKKKFDSM